MRLRLPGEASARAVAERAVLLVAVYELWAEAPNFPLLCAALDGFPSERSSPFRDASVPWRLMVDAFGKSLSMPEAQVWDEW